MQWRQTGAGGEWFQARLPARVGGGERRRRGRPSTLRHALSPLAQTVDLAPGSHQYKFIVDAQWRHDHTAPTVLDSLGNVNNCITIDGPAAKPEGDGDDASAPKPAPVAAAASADAAETPSAAETPAAEAPAAESAGPVCAAVPSAAQQEPDAPQRCTSDPYHVGGSKFQAGEEATYGQTVPARDELLVHHSASLMLPPQLRLLLPQHHGDANTMPLPVQMHHMFCHFGDDVSVFAMAHRYRERSVTQLLYKPSRTARGADGGGGGGGSSAVGAAAPAAASPLCRRASELRSKNRDVVLQSVRISGSQRQREDSGSEYVVYSVESVLCVHGMLTTLRSERRYRHFHLLDQLLHQQFGALVPQAMPAKRAFGNLQPGFVEERRVALERYLQLCVAIPELAASSIFCNFVEAGDGPTQAFERQAEGAALMERVSAKQGHLLKRGRRVASWKRRYFCLCDSVLYYYYSIEMSNPFAPLGVVSLYERKDDAADSPDAPDAAAPASCVTVQLVADRGLPRHAAFALHTEQRTWCLAADSVAERDGWVRALCQAGAHLSGSGAEVPAAPLAAWEEPGAERDGAPSEADGGGASGGYDRSGDTVSGTLWKRGSKVHLAAAPQSREWVSRHFVLLPAEGAVVYAQQASEPLSQARGVVPLGGFDGVEDAEAPNGTLHAFRLTSAAAGADGALLLAASSAEEKEMWMAGLAEAIEAAVKRAAAAPAAAAAPSSSESSLSASVQQHLTLSSV